MLALIIISINTNAQILWKVESSETSAKSYILGTHHLADNSIVESLNSLPEIMDIIDEMYFEVSIDSLMSTDGQLLLQKEMMMPNGKFITPYFNIDETIAINNYLKPIFGGGIALFCHLKPAAIQYSISNLYLQSVSLADKPTIDWYLETCAHTESIPCKYLETVAEHVKIPFSQNIKDQALELLRYIDIPSDSIMVAHRTILNAYQNRDFDKINKIMIEDSIEDHYSYIVVNRNMKWANIILSQLPRKSLLIVVGIGHLCGEKGLINILQNNGYTIEAIE